MLSAMVSPECRDDYSDQMRQRLWPVPSEESQPEVKKNSPSFLLDKVMGGLSLRTDHDHRDQEYSSQFDVGMSSPSFFVNKVMGGLSSRRSDNKDHGDLSLRSGNDRRDNDLSYEIYDDYNDEDFEYEPLVFFDVPRPGEGEIVIAVQAATISSLKSKVHQEVKIDNVSLDLNSGIAIVGVVREIGPHVTRWKVGDRVATIIKSMMKNARYARVLETTVVDVPCGLDSAESAAVAYTYLLGFQSLTHGIVNQQLRYSNDVFQGKSILIIDGASTSGLAIVQLAKSLGAEAVYATGKLHRHDLLRSFGAEPLDEQPINWMMTVEGKMDIVIDMKMAKTFQHYEAEKALKATGKMVYVGYPISIDSLKYGSADSWKCLFEQLVAQIALIFARANATYYDLFSHFDNYPEELKVRRGHQSLFFKSRTWSNFTFLCLLFIPSEERFETCSLHVS